MLTLITHRNDMPSASSCMVDHNSWIGCHGNCMTDQRICPSPSCGWMIWILCIKTKVNEGWTEPWVKNAHVLNTEPSSTLPTWPAEWVWVTLTGSNQLLSNTKLFSQNFQFQKIAVSLDQLLRSLEQFRSVPINSDQFRSVWTSFEQFRSLPITSDHFRSVLTSFEQFRSDPINSDRFLLVPISSDQFQSVPISSD